MKRRDLLAGAVTVPALALAQQVDWKPMTLSANQNETIVILTDLIIPTTDTLGAKETNVNRYIDLFLTDGPSAQREQFLQGLAKLEDFASKTHGKPFRSCKRDQQIAVIKQASDGQAPKAVTEFFGRVKSITSRIYYNTAAGHEELNKGGRVPQSFACKA